MKLYLFSQQNVHHYYRSLGGWTFAFDDYYKLNFTQQLDNPATQMMADIIDPLGMLYLIWLNSLVPQSTDIQSYSLMCKIYTGYCGTSEIEHGLCACTVDNPLAEARGLSLRTGAQTMLYLSLVITIMSLQICIYYNIYIIRIRVISWWRNLKSLTGTFFQLTLKDDCELLFSFDI